MQWVFKSSRRGFEPALSTFVTLIYSKDKYVFLLNHSRHLFLYFLLFNTADGYYSLPMTGIKLQTSGIASNHCTN